MHEHVAQRTQEVRGFILSHRLVLNIIILAALFDTISCFLPWGINATSGSSVYIYLPWTPILYFGQEALVLSDAFDFFFMAIVLRAAVVLAWVGIVMYEYFEKRQYMPYIVIFISGILSFLAFILFIQTFIGLWLGAYLVLFSAGFKIITVLVKALKVEFVIEHDK